MGGPESSAEGSPEPSASRPPLPRETSDFNLSPYDTAFESDGPLLPDFPSRVLGDKTRERQSVESGPVGRATSGADGLSLRLGMAIEARDLDEVTKIIKAGVDVNRPYRRTGVFGWNRAGYLPINRAAVAGKEITKLLIDSGAIVDAQVGQNGTALQNAARWGDYETVELLINAGADVNAPPGPDGTALVCAVRSKKASLEKARLLLEHGAEVNGKSERGTALQYAALMGDYETVELLINAGADVNAPPGPNGTTLACAIGSNKASLEKVRLLLEHGVEVNGKSWRGTILQYAARWGDYETVELLINAGADVNAPPGAAGTALVCAIESNKASLQKLRLLLEHGAEVYGKSWWGTQIVRLAQCGRPALFPIFLAQGVDITAVPGVPDLWHNLSRKQPYDSIVRLGSDLIAGDAISTIRGISFDWTTPAGLVHSFERSSPTFDRPVENPSAELLARQFVLVAERSPDNEPSMILGTRCSEFTLDHWGIDGLISLQCIMENIYGNFDNGPKSCAIIHDHPDISSCRYLDEISCSDSRVELLLGTMQPHAEDLKTLLSVVSFFCTAIGDPLVSTPFVSTSSRIHLEVDPPSVMDIERPLRLRLFVDKAPFCPSRDNCWQSLLEVGVVARVETPRPTPTLPGRGIRLTFDLMVALASIERSILINKTIILIGYRTALIPIEIQDDFVQYHLMVSDSDQIDPHCFPNELEKAVDVNDIDQLLHKSCFTGWCGEVHIQLGTTLMTKLTLPRYSTAREKGESFHLNGINLSMSALLPAPVQVGPTLQLEGTFRINRVKFTYLSGYAELLRDTSRKTILLYDTATKRGWMVPKLSLLLHMCHAYMAFHEEQDSIPIIPGSSDAKPIVKALDKEGNLALFGSPPHEFRLHNLLHGLNYNMRLVAEKTEPSKGHTLNGFEFRDIFAMPDKGALMKKITLDTNGRSWIHMANLADAVIFGQGFGDVITAPRIGNWARLDNCIAVPAGFEYLTTTVPYLKNLAFNRPGFVNQEVQDYQIEIDEGIFWAVSMASFNKCNLKHANNGSCWNIDDIFQQLLKPKLRKNGAGRPQISLSQLPDTGAVVFGCSPPSKRPET